MENWAQSDIVARKDAMPLDVQLLIPRTEFVSECLIHYFSMFAVRSKDPSPARKSIATHCI